MLDQLFHADRTSLLTELMVTVIREFGIDMSQLHNDSTSISVHGDYASAARGKVAGTPTPAITYGHSKDRRPDLKQLVYILTVTADGAVPVLYRLADGNTCDDPTHVPTWDDLAALTGRTDFVYVADCKLASEEAMRHIDRHDGLFVTVLPRSRKEDAQFRTWAISNDPGFTEIIRRPGKRLGDPDQVISAVRAPWPSAEGFPVIWVHDSAKQHRDAATRQRRIAKATTAISELNDRLAGPRCRIKEESAVHQAAAAAIAGCCAERWVSYEVRQHTTEHFRQAAAGRPGPATTYKKVTASHWKVTITIDDQQIRDDAATDGCYPLVTNGRQFTDLYVVEAYHGQPHLERRAELPGVAGIGDPQRRHRGLPEAHRNVSRPARPHRARHGTDRERHRASRPAQVRNPGRQPGQGRHRRGIRRPVRPHDRELRIRRHNARPPAQPVSPAGPALAATALPRDVGDHIAGTGRGRRLRVRPHLRRACLLQPAQRRPVRGSPGGGDQGAEQPRRMRRPLRLIRPDPRGVIPAIAQPGPDHQRHLLIPRRRPW